MLKVLILLVNRLNGIFSSDVFSRNDAVETKKCMNCLKRVELDWFKCPYCRCSDFHIGEN